MYRRVCWELKFTPAGFGLVYTGTLLSGAFYTGLVPQGLSRGGTELRSGTVIWIFRYLAGQVAIRQGAKNGRPYQVAG